MQSENGIVSLFYIFLSHGNEKKKKKKKNGKKKKRGDTVSCPQAPVKQGWPGNTSGGNSQW
jgi:hypothetical protein